MDERSWLNVQSGHSEVGVIPIGNYVRRDNSDQPMFGFRSPGPHRHLLVVGYYTLLSCARSKGNAEKAAKATHTASHN